MQRRFVLLVPAVLFAGATLLYTTLWMIAVRWMPAVELGFNNTGGNQVWVTDVYAASPAKAAGLRVGDRIVAIDGHVLGSRFSLFQGYAPHRPGDTVELRIERPGAPAPLTLRAVFRRRQFAGVAAKSVGENLIAQLRNLHPVPFVLVGLTVLFLRLEDPQVWLLALLFGSLASTEGLPDPALVLTPPLQAFARAYQAVSIGMLGAWFYWFFAVFPTRSPLDRRLPWLKWAAAGIGITVALPGLRSGTMRLPSPAVELLGEGLSGRVTLVYALFFLSLGLVSLGLNFFRPPDREARRKIRVIFWATCVGLCPSLVSVAVQNFTGVHTPPWVSGAATVLGFLIPLSFAYAVIKHRVLDVPVLLKRSARYLLVQRGFTVLLSLLSIALTLLFAFSLDRYLRPVVEAAQPSGIALGAVFGTVLLWGGSQVHRQVSGRIDRAFFRAAYDARVILEDLAEKTRTVADRAELAGLLEDHLVAALRPTRLVIYLEGSDGMLAAVRGAVPDALRALPPKPFVAANPEALAPLQPEFVAPIAGRGSRLAGLLLLGPRLSEEPYSGEDRRLLASVASQAGIALENIRLAEEIAARLEAERRVAREMEIASEVQNRLLPQSLPRLRHLECAARCLQARAVGGDYYDFLDLGPSRAGFVLADISGKGVHAALLMANLQAHLRSQSGIAPLDPVRLMQQVNRLLWSSTAARHYATLFFGIYDDAAGRLTYINCGHNAPVWLHPDGRLDRLEATATVIGIFEQWECSVETVQFAPGDLLVIYSDGVTEAAGEDEDFGEERLIEELRACRARPAGEILAAVFDRVQRFSRGEQSDDLTLLVLKMGTDAR